MNQENKFYVTTPIYYVTAKPHLGSLYSTLLADVAARWHKLRGYDTFFLTGTDEHGQKIAQAAEKAGMEPQAFVDSFIAAYQSVWKKYNIHYDYFIRTTDAAHVEAVQQWIRQLQEKGDIYKSFYKGWYCTHCETFAHDEEGAQQPPCPSCGRPTQLISEESYFFKLSAYQDKLLAFYEKHPDFIMPKERAHEVINFVKSGLKDLSISRTTVKWGIPFPGDPKHTVYVWADALNNYITAVGWGNPKRAAEFARWWPADLHVMGKDIVRFHAIYWPAFLMASNLPLPHHLLVHGWIKVGDQKMSKSLGNVIDPEVLQTTYGTDPVRYYLVRQLAITHDSEFSVSELEQKIETDLANDLGNLLNRMLVLVEKSHDFHIPAPIEWSQLSINLRDASFQTAQEFNSHMLDNNYHLALASLWKFIHQVNAYFHQHEPWKVTDINKFREIVSATCHSLRAIALLAWPVMPTKMTELLQALGQSFEVGPDHVASLISGVWETNFTLNKVPPLFAKIERKEDTNAIAPNNKSSDSSVAPSSTLSSTISIDDVVKVELRVGAILSCEPVAKSDKLYQLQVDFGDLGKRQILAGVRSYFTPDQMIGKQAVFVFNLAPRKMLGHESQGMLLVAAGNMVAPMQPVPNGTRLQ